MTFESILKSIEDKKIHPLYFLYGEESYFIDQIIKHLETHVLSEAERDFNQITLYGSDTSAVEIVDTLSRIPMLSKYQLVIVKEAQHLKKIDDLLPYIQSPNPSSILCISYRKKQIDKRKKIFSTIIKQGIVLESKKLYENQIPIWIEMYVTQKEGRIESKATHLLASFLGSNLATISQEINKIIHLKSSTNEPINTDDIERYVGISKDFNVFEIQEALGKKDTQKINRIIHYCKQNPKAIPVPALIANLTIFFARLYVYVHAKKQEPLAILKAMNMSKNQSWMLRQYHTASTHYNLSQVESTISVLHQYDLKSKGINYVKSNDTALLKELLLRIIHT